MIEIEIMMIELNMKNDAIRWFDTFSFFHIISLFKETAVSGHAVYTNKNMIFYLYHTSVHG